jgi:ferredoxin
VTHVRQVDEDACKASGACVNTAPEVFELEDVSKVVGTAPDDVLLAAAKACPKRAIRIVDQDTNLQIYP